MAATPKAFRLAEIFLHRATGGSSSVMTTLKSQVLMPPSPSVITAWTVLVPTAKVEPLVGLEVTLVTVQAFTAGKVQVTLLLLQWARSALAALYGGHGKDRQS